MEKVIAYSAFLISFSILNIGSIIIMNNAFTIDFFYNIAAIFFIISTLGLIISLAALLIHIFKPSN